MAITDTIPRIDALREDRVILPAAAPAYPLANLLARRQGRVEDGRVEVLGDLGLGDGFGRGEGGAGVIAGVLELLARGERGVEGCWVEGLEDGRVTLVGVGHTLIDGAGFRGEFLGGSRMEVVWRSEELVLVVCGSLLLVQWDDRPRGSKGDSVRSKRTTGF